MRLAATTRANRTPFPVAYSVSKFDRHCRLRTGEEDELDNEAKTAAYDRILASRMPNKPATMARFEPAALNKKVYSIDQFSS